MRPLRSPRAARGFGLPFSLVVLGSCSVFACGPSKPPQGPLPHALDHRVEWYNAELREGRDAEGQSVDEIPLRGGDVVRITTDATGPVELGERVRSGAGFAETWTRATPDNGHIIVRSTIFGAAILLPRGTAKHAHIGLGHDPGYEWFELEDRVLDWAAGPLPATFPSIGPAERIDFAALGKLDRVLAAAVAKASDPEKARDSAVAIRRVAGLRAVRAIRPNDGFPYFYDHWAAPEGEASKKQRLINGRKTYLVSPSDPLAIEVEGPRVLLLSTYGVRRNEDERVDIRVLEGEHVRAKSGGDLPRVKTAAGTGLETTAEEAEALPLRRATVHVPPGKHAYKLEVKGGSVFAAIQLSKAAVHIGDGITGHKDEARLLRIAHETTEPTLLALADALAATEGSTAALGAEARDVATELSEGGPRDPLIALELRAARGDADALAALGQAARSVIDDGVRGAWLRGTTRGTRWVVSDAKDLHEGHRWLSMIVPSEGEAMRPECITIAGNAWTEVGRDETPYATTIWRGAHAIELMAAASCSAQGPIGLEIEGEKLLASPASPLARWHVLVHGKTARIKRTDNGEGKVWGLKPDAAACGAHWGFIGAPRPAKDSPEISWNKQASAPGLELWLRDGTGKLELEIVSRVDPQKRVTVRSEGRNGFIAIDPQGARWVRVGRVGVPTWAVADGVTIKGDDRAAVRAIVRAPKTDDDLAGQPTATPEGEVAEAESPDEEKLVAVSQAINRALGAARAPHYLERALMLARAGEARAAIEDARAAKALGGKAPASAASDNLVAYVRSAIRSKTRRSLELPAAVKAYGIEPDFDAGGARCTPSTNGPRGKLAAVVEELKTAKAAQSKVWDPKLAIRAYEAVTANAINPRGDSVLSWALAGSRWQLPKSVESTLLKVQRPHDVGGGPGKDGAIDPEGDLRARILAGMPFERSSYATVVQGRPARIALTGSNGTTARVEIVCVPRSPGDALDFKKCPIGITVGAGPVMHPPVGPDGHAVFELPALPQKGANASATIALEPAPGRFIALARVVFNGEVPGTTKVDGVGYVVMPDGLQWRWLVKSGEELKTNFSGPGLLRIDARREPDESPKVVVIVDGKEQAVPIDGTPKIVAVPNAGQVIVRSMGGASTIAVAERVAKPALPDLLAVDEQEADPKLVEPPDEASAVSSPALIDAGDPTAGWRDTATRSPRPLTPFEENVGTLTTRSLGKAGTLREGNPKSNEIDSYFEQAIGYRRRIESIDLWTGITGLYRARRGADSYGGELFLYKTISPVRLRMAAWLDAYGQKVGLTDAHTIHPHGYVEFSARVSSTFFLLPRVGYDGFYSNLIERPKAGLADVDDDIYNDFRFRRSTLLYGQLLSWWVPYFNSILWTRTRASFDADTKSLSHVAFRPGGYFALDRFEVDLFAEATWFAAVQGLRPDSKTNYTGAAYIFYNAWYGNGSLDIQPGIGARARANDGAWEVYALFNVLASFQRGLRDFASPELNFPEQFGGSVAWRGFVPGGMR